MKDFIYTILLLLSTFIFNACHHKETDVIIINDTITSPTIIIDTIKKDSILLVEENIVNNTNSDTLAYHITYVCGRKFKNVDMYEFIEYCIADSILIGEKSFPLTPTVILHPPNHYELTLDEWLSQKELYIASYWNLSSVPGWHNVEEFE